MSKNQDKIFVFHGCDYKVGTTMTAQASAELIAKKRKDLKILFLCLNGRASTNYCGEDVKSIEMIKMRADNNLLTEEDIRKISCMKNELHVIGGVSGILTHRYYSTEFPEQILHLAVNIFDLIVVDSGNDIDSGLAVGALKLTEHRFMVMAQNETILRRYEIIKSLYDALDISFKYFVINRYAKDDPHDEKYIRKRLNMTEKEKVIMLSDENEYARYAEIDHNTLLDYKCGEYFSGIGEIAGNILELSGKGDGDELRMRKKASGLLRWRDE